MNSIAPRRTQPLTLLIALILAIGSAMFADQVSASCGDYLHTSEAGDALPSHHDDSVPVCSGPNCSTGSLTLTPLPPVAKRGVVEIAGATSARFEHQEDHMIAALFPARCEIYSSATPDVLLRPPIIAAV